MHRSALALQVDDVAVCVVGQTKDLCAIYIDLLETASVTVGVVDRSLGVVRALGDRGNAAELVTFYLLGKIHVRHSTETCLLSNQTAGIVEVAVRRQSPKMQGDRQPGWIALDLETADGGNQTIVVAAVTQLVLAIDATGSEAVVVAKGAFDLAQVRAHRLLRTTPGRRRTGNGLHRPRSVETSFN